MEQVLEKKEQLAFGPFSERTELECETFYVEMYEILEMFGQDTVLYEVNQRLSCDRLNGEPAWSSKLKVFLEEIALTLAWRAFRINRTGRILGESGPGIFGKIVLQVGTRRVDLNQLSVQIEKAVQCYANMIDVLCQNVLGLSGVALASIRGELLAYALKPGLKAEPGLNADLRECFCRFAKACSAAAPAVTDSIPDPDVMLQGMNLWALEMTTIPLDLREIMLNGLTDCGKLVVPSEIFGNTCNILKVARQANLENL
jgi:hypothetical protein